MKNDGPAGRPGFPPPLSISDEAKVALAVAPSSLDFSTLDFSTFTDPESWRRHIATRNEALGKMFSLASPTIAAQAAWENIGGVPCVRAAPDNPQFPRGKVYLDIHGGGFIYLGGEHVKALALQTAANVRSHVVSIDYRMPPDHPFPAGLDDCLAVYAALIKEVGSENLIVAGASSGGNLAAAMLMRARDAGLAMPCALVMLTPAVDLTESGDTFQTLLGVDRIGSFMPVFRLYADGQPLDHPYLSPLFGDLSGFPPTFLQSGTRDLFLSNTVRMHRALRRLGVEAELHVWEAMPHGSFCGAPEDEEVDTEIRQFMFKHWGTTS